MMSFNICIMKAPGNRWDESIGDRRLDTRFDETDFDGLHNLLGIRPVSIPRLADESYVDHEKRLKEKYLDSARNQSYPLLGRIWYWYESVAYLPHEIDDLIEECTRLKNRAHDKDQLVPLAKLIAACENAIENDSGLYLASN